MHVPVRLGPAEAAADRAAERRAARPPRPSGWRTSGLPTRKVESYHYTDLKMLLRAVPELAGCREGA